MSGTIVREMTFQSALSENGMTGWTVSVERSAPAGPMPVSQSYLNGTLMRLAIGLESFFASSALSSPPPASDWASTAAPVRDKPAASANLMKVEQYFGTTICLEQSADRIAAAGETSGACLAESSGPRSLLLRLLLRLLLLGLLRSTQSADHRADGCPLAPAAAGGGGNAGAEKSATRGVFRDGPRGWRRLARLRGRIQRIEPGLPHCPLIALVFVRLLLLRALTSRRVDEGLLLCQDRHADKRRCRRPNQIFGFHFRPW